MSKRNQNREKAAAGAEAPHRSVQSAIREQARQVARQVGGRAAYRARVKKTVFTACAMFGGQVAEVRT